MHFQISIIYIRIEFFKLRTKSVHTAKIMLHPNERVMFKRKYLVHEPTGSRTFSHEI